MRSFVEQRHAELARKGRVSGAALDETIAHLWELRDGRPLRLRMFGDAAKAKERFLRESPGG